MVVAGGILPSHHEHVVVSHLLGSSGGNKPFTLLSDYIGYVSLLGPEIIPHGFAFVLLLSVFKERITKFFANRVQTELGKYQTTVHVHLDHFRLEFDLSVLYIPFPKQIGPVTGSHQYGILGLIGNHGIQRILLFADGILSHQGICLDLKRVGSKLYGIFRYRNRILPGRSRRIIGYTNLLGAYHQTSQKGDK